MHRILGVAGIATLSLLVSALPVCAQEGLIDHIFLVNDISPDQSNFSFLSPQNISPDPAVDHAHQISPTHRWTGPHFGHVRLPDLVGLARFHAAFWVNSENGCGSCHTAFVSRQRRPRRLDWWLPRCRRLRGPN